MTDKSDGYCRNCGYLDWSRITYAETCNTCHIPVEWHEADERREVERLRLDVIADQRNIADLKERIKILDLEIEADNRNTVDFIDRIAELEKSFASLEQQIKREDLRDWMTAKNNLIEELHKQLETAKTINKTLVRDLDECQRANDKLAGISNE